jgi:sensor c-di-GMP phosphodiesterase-like protein
MDFHLPFKLRLPRRAVAGASVDSALGALASLPSGQRAATGSSTLRLLSLDPLRVWGLSAVVLLLSVLAAWAMNYTQSREAMQAAAQQALSHIELRLEDIELELRAAARLADDTEAVHACGPDLQKQLIRKSLGSEHLRSMALMPRAGTGLNGESTTACGPEGSQPALEAAQQARAGALYISSTQTIASRLWVALADDSQVVAVGELNPEFMSEPGPMALQTLASHGLQLSLMTASGQRLRGWGSAPASNESWQASTLPSQRHALEVHVTQSLGAWLNCLGERMLFTAPLFLLLAGLGLAVHVRFTFQRARLTYRLARALRKRQFEPFVQPIISLADGRCIGAEVLMRWAHPQRGIVAPGEFIDTAEKTGLIGPMSELTMTRAAHRLASLAREQPQLYFSFNLTPGQLRQPGLSDWLATCFSSDTLRREQVLLEVTERDAVDESALAALRHLHQQQWRLAVDDFGTGHSSLAVLETLPLHSLKIDRAFVNTVSDDTSRAPVLDAIIALGTELRLKLIAEGIETQAQWNYLASRGVHCAQGYLMARPMSIEAFIQWFAARASELGKASASALPAAGANNGTYASANFNDKPAALADDQALAALWQRMQSTGGIDIRDRLYHLRNYRHCFVAREAVDWLVRQEGLSRAEAVRTGQRLEALGKIHHVVNEHGFADAELFFTTATALETSNAAPPIAELRAALKNAHGGPAWRVQKRGLMRHARCTSGSEILNWMQSRYAVPRAVAQQWAAHLMRHGLLHHVFDDQPFRDDANLYRLA